MGMFDHVVVLDETLRCPHGHQVDGFQTKSFADPSMATYLIEGSRVYLVARGGLLDSDEAVAGRWRLDGNEAVFQQRHRAEPVVPPAEILFYTACAECPPVLIRCDRPRAWGDLIDERFLWVEFRAVFDPNGMRHVERTSGTRDDLIVELREEGLRVMRDDEPLAIAHREIRAARDAPWPARQRARR